MPDWQPTAAAALRRLVLAALRDAPGNVRIASRRLGLSQAPIDGNLANRGAS
jgi:hypothetical protein